ncbi:glycosyltransferase [Terrimonas sp. NA20]|uniref:Glycosyltransferase n=1 Tax=Terrimonas ginsenosidimutans TaxID=2908004 RepID=A0ABS9KST9_9BACT|nr:glycosyltransferase [Terrimonas ginsenosidimutans]MCG2615396.1 glycosyltransferase [Terrimonas ginsenosidimutans]
MARYSIILPVKNGGNYLRECVQSILSQAVNDFELLVLENQSTDNTLDILASFNDQRIKIFPAPTSLTMEDNWHRALSLPKSEFMTLIGHDDILHKNYLCVMQELIAKYPDASLYQTHFRYIDSSGNEIGKCKHMNAVQDPATALSHFLLDKIDLMGTGFMMRSRDFEAAGGMPMYPNLLFADMELWIRLSRKNFLAVDSQECFSYRKHPAATTSSSSDARFINAFDLLMKYLIGLKHDDPELASVIKRDGVELLRQYCQGITHKVLRTPKSKRETPSVGQLIHTFRQYGKDLCDGKFEPLDYRKIKVGKLIDSNPISHGIFLLFKKIYHKPVLKSH